MRLQLILPERREILWRRGDMKIDVLYNNFRCREVTAVFLRKANCLRSFTDDMAEQLLSLGLITPVQKQAYEARIFETFSRLSRFDGVGPEQLYPVFESVRREVLGGEVLERLRRHVIDSPLPFQPEGIDQSRKKSELLHRCGGVLLVLREASLWGCMARDLEAARRLGKPVWVAVSEAPGGWLPTARTLSLGDAVRYVTCDGGTLSGDGELAERIEEGKALLLFYGEEGLTRCRSLRIDAVVHAVPRGFCAQAVTNMLDRPEGCVVYVPPGYDLPSQVPLNRKTRLTWWHLARLWVRHGDGVYRLPVAELYRRWPEEFMSIYDREGPWPLRPAMERADLAHFEALREAAIGDHLNSLPGVRYFAAYYDEALKLAPLCFDEQAGMQPGILVHGVRIARSRGARVIPLGSTMRQHLQEHPAGGEAIVSNFLFFLTPKLGQLYNDLRADRPLEQADAAAGHLDYSLCFRDGRRVETFPLFRKAGVAMLAEGRFVFFHFALGGGSVTLGDQQFCWSKADVDGGDGEVRVHTPYSTWQERDADRETYRKLVGQDRVNLVILQDRVVAVRRGAVVLPSVGVVLSLSEDRARHLLAGLQPLKDGYYDVKNLELTVTLDGPEEVAPEDWARVQWAYGGGMTLMSRGEGRWGEDWEDQVAREGWLSPLSRQTQEAALHTLVRHPRTAIGVAENGDLAVLVFSGRTWRSGGADYRQMCAIARQLVPDIRELMNVDGGGSAMLGLAWGKGFMELSCPSTSSRSCAGMTRPVHTVLYIPMEDGCGSPKEFP